MGTSYGERMNLIVLDSEGDGLAYDCTKLYNLCSTSDGENFFYTTNYEEMREHLLSADLLVCHNGVRHDSVVFKRILGVDIPYNKWIDTLAISWALYPDRSKHGLESWGETVGIKKVEVKQEEWSEGDEELMKSRVIRDVDINYRVWIKMLSRLKEIYN